MNANAKIKMKKKKNHGNIGKPRPSLAAPPSPPAAPVFIPIKKNLLKQSFFSIICGYEVVCYCLVSSIAFFKKSRRGYVKKIPQVARHIAMGFR